MSIEHEINQWLKKNFKITPCEKDIKNMIDILKKIVKIAITEEKIVTIEEKIG